MDIIVNALSRGRFGYRVRESLQGVCRLWIFLSTPSPEGDLPGQTNQVRDALATIPAKITLDIYRLHL
jgi:hypothetical protein